MKLTKNQFYIIFAAIILLGGFLRLYNLNATSFTADEFLGVNTSYGYLKTGEWKRWDFNLNKVADDKAYAHTLFDFSSEESAQGGSYTRAWMYNWQVAQALKLFSPTKELSFRMISVLWGMISIVAIYFAAVLFTKKRMIGLISAFLFAISISAILFDRKVRMYSMFLPVYLIFSWLFFQFLEDDKNLKNKLIKKLHQLTGLNFLYAVPLFLAGLLAFHLHLLAANLLITVLVYLIYRAAEIYREKKSIFSFYTRYIVLAIGIFTLGFIFFPRQVAPFVVSFSMVNHSSYFDKVLSDYNNYLLALALMALGAYWLWKNQKKGGMFVNLSFFVPLILAVFFWNRTPGEQYIFFVKSFEIIILASGIYFIADFTKNRFIGQEKYAYGIAVTAILLLLPNYAYFFQENNTYFQTSRSDDPSYRKVFAYYLKNKKDGEVLVTRWFRNYYFPKANADLITYGGERSEKDEKKVNAERLKKIQSENSCGWFIWSESDDDYITADAKDYARKNFDQINDPQVRGTVTVNHWCNN